MAVSRTHSACCTVTIYTTFGEDMQQIYQITIIVVQGSTAVPRCVEEGLGLLGQRWSITADLQNTTQY